MTSALGNIGTGDLTVVRIKEEPSLGGTITTSTFVDARKNRAFFQRIPNVVGTDYANAVMTGYNKEVFHSTAGILAFEMDLNKICWFLKWIMGTITSEQQGTTSEYKHTFKFGVTTLKSCKVFSDVGGLSSALNLNWLGQAIDRLGFIVNLFDTVRCESIFVGQTDEVGSGPGTPTYAEPNLTVAFGNAKWYTGVAGLTTIAAMTQWKDPDDMRFEIARNRKADNFRSDNTGKTAGITNGVPSLSCMCAGQLTTEHEYTNFRTSVERAFACRLDTELLIPSGNGSNYMIDFVMPRVRFRSYNLNADGTGPIRPAIDIMPGYDPTAQYDLRIDAYNNTVSYPDAT